MQITVEEVERIKHDFDTFQQFAQLMFELIGARDDFDAFSSDLNKVVVDLAIGPDSQPALATRLQYLFNQRVKHRAQLRRHLSDPHVTAYRQFLLDVDEKRNLGLARRDVRALTVRHVHFLQEFLARHPFNK